MDTSVALYRRDLAPTDKGTGMLVKLEQAKLWLESATQPDEIWEMKNTAQAAEEYATAKKDEELLQRARAVKIFALARLGILFPVDTRGRHTRLLPIAKVKEVHRLRIKGFSNSAIAKEIGVSDSFVRSTLKKPFATLVAERSKTEAARSVAINQINLAKKHGIPQSAILLARKLARKSKIELDEIARGGVSIQSVRHNTRLSKNSETFGFLANQYGVHSFTSIFSKLLEHNPKDYGRDLTDEECFKLLPAARGIADWMVTFIDRLEKRGIK